MAPKCLLLSENIYNRNIKVRVNVDLKSKNIFLKNLGRITFQITFFEWLQKIQDIKFFTGHRLAHQYSITFLGLINFELEIARNSLLFIAVSRLKKSHDNISCSIKLLNASTLLLKFENSISFIIKKSGQDFCHLVQQEPHSLYQHKFFPHSLKSYKLNTTHLLQISTKLFYYK